MVWSFTRCPAITLIALADGFDLGSVQGSLVCGEPILGSRCRVLFAKFGKTKVLLPECDLRFTPGKRREVTNGGQTNAEPENARQARVSPWTGWGSQRPDASTVDPECTFVDAQQRLLPLSRSVSRPPAWTNSYLILVRRGSGPAPPKQRPRIASSTTSLPPRSPLSGCMERKVSGNLRPSQAPVRLVRQSVLDNEVPHYMGGWPSVSRPRLPFAQSRTPTLTSPGSRPSRPTHLGEIIVAYAKWRTTTEPARGLAKGPGYPELITLR